MLGLAQDVVNDAAVAAQGVAESVGMAKDGAGVLADGRVFGWGRGIDKGMLDEERAFEGDEGGVGDIEDDEFGSDEQAMELPGRHRFRAAAAGLGFGVCANTSRKSFSSRRASSRSAATVSSSSARFMRTR